ncbi:MAG: hypothetical protein FAF05_03015 [Epsilonproteobacteria bacterium]|nr:hypothetical protein [Campylobacterota bacterium]
MKKENEALKEIGKGLIAFANLFTALSFINAFVVTKTFNSVEFVAIIYVFLMLYFTGYKFIKKGGTP